MVGVVGGLVPIRFTTVTNTRALAVGVTDAVEYEFASVVLKLLVRVFEVIAITR